MDFDLNETVQLNGRPVSLLDAVREIMQLPAVKRFPGLAWRYFATQGSNRLFSSFPM